MLAGQETRAVLSTTVTILPSVNDKFVFRCDRCKRVQFLNIKNSCVVCHAIFIPQGNKSSVFEEIAPMKENPAHFDPVFLATEIRKKRTVLRLSQSKMAKRMRVPRTYISRLERGITTPTLKSLANIAEALEMTTEDLLDGKNTPNFNIELVRLLQSCPEEKRVGLEEMVLSFLSDFH